jgi:hypothetical protein
VAEQLSLEIQREGPVPGAKSGVTADEMAWTFAARVREWGGAAPLEWPEQEPNLDYVSLVDAEYQKRRRKRG